jgi:hypothetical protein
MYFKFRLLIPLLNNLKIFFGITVLMKKTHKIDIDKRSHYDF